jgi:hypothetical protein
LTGPARPDEYSWELFGASTRTELDVLSDTDRALVGATRYFSPVEDGTGPLPLAAFLDPATRIAVAASREMQQSHAIGPGSEDVPDLVTRRDEFSVAGRYVFPRSKWYAGGSYARPDLEPPQELLDTAADSDSYGVLLGKYLGAATTLELRAERTEDRSEGPALFCIVGQLCGVGGRTTTETRTDDVSLAAMHVRTFRRLTYALSGRVAQASGDVVLHQSEFTIPFPFQPPSPVFGVVPRITIPARTTELSLPRRRSYTAGAELFPTPKLGLRLGYTRFDDDTAADDAYEASATWFFRRNIGVDLGYSRQSTDASATFRHTDSAAVRIIGRL